MFDPFPTCFGYPDLVGWLNNLGYCCSKSSEPSHVDQPVEPFEKEWECENGVPKYRVTAALQLIRLIKSQKDWNQASVCVEVAKGF